MDWRYDNAIYYIEDVGPLGPRGAFSGGLAVVVVGGFISEARGCMLEVVLRILLLGMTTQYITLQGRHVLVM